MRMMKRASVLMVLAAVVWVLAGCGGSPPKSEMEAAIEKAVRGARGELIEATANAVEVASVRLVDVKLIKSETRENAGYPVHGGSWTAKIRFKEPHAWVVAMVDGTMIVRTVAKKGDELEVRGDIRARKDEDSGEWRIFAHLDGDPYEPLTAKVVGPDGMAQVFSFPTVNGLSQTNTRRGIALRPLAQLSPHVEEGTPEVEALLKASNERRARAQQEAAEAHRLRMEAQAEQRRQEQAKREEEYRQQQAAREEERRLAREAAEEQRRIAQEEAARQAEAQRRARLLPMLKPLASPTGVAVTTDAGALMGTIILEAVLDEEAFTATGSGIDLRQMPFREFTFEASVSDRAVLQVQTSIHPQPHQFSRSTGVALTGSNIALTPLSEGERAQVDAIVRDGRRLAGASPSDLATEVLEAEAAKPREMELRLEGIPGTILYRDRSSPNLAPLLAGAAMSRATTWRRDTVSVRLAEPARAKGIYIRGGSASDNLLVVVNGVHRARIESIPRGGAAQITLPPDLEVIDIRFEAIGTASSLGIGFIR